MKTRLQLPLRFHTRRFQICLIFALALAFTITSQAQSAEKIHKWAKRIVADYDNGSKYLDPPYDVAQIPFHKLTHINHAGVPWNSDGSLSIPTGFVEPELIKRAHAHGVKVLLLTGGDFSAVENSPAVLDTVICNLKMFVTEHDYDGLDIDWEFPQSSEDKNFFATLMSKLRAAFPSPRYELSIDVAPWNIEFYPLKRLVPTIDFFNLMVYDCAGPWTSEGHLNSPIFWDNKDPNPGECEPGASDQQALNMYLKTIPASQINLGTPFYGYYYTNINQIFQTCPNAATTSDGFCDNTVLTVNYGPDIKQLINKNGWERHYDPVSFVPYLLRSDGLDGYITYDDAVSTYLRVWYADWIREVGGTFMWSLDADYDGHSQDLLDAMYRATTGQ